MSGEGHSWEGREGEQCWERRRGEDSYGGLPRGRGIVVALQGVVDVGGDGCKRLIFVGCCALT